MAPVGVARLLAVGRNTLILLVSNFSSAAFGLLISILIGRNAGDAALGAYSLALAWSLTLSQFADLGMNTLLTRDLARAPAQTASYLRASLLSKTALGLVLILGLVLAAPALAQGDAPIRALQLGAALILINTWYAGFTAIFRAFGRMMPILVINVCGLALQAALTWLLIQRGAGVEALVGLVVGIQFLQLAAATLIYLRQFPRARTKTTTDWHFALQLTRAGIPFAIAGIVAGVELRANIFLLGALQGERAVGWYSAASRLTDGIRLAPNAFFGAMLPALSALYATQDRAQLRQFFQKREWAMIAFGGAAALLLTLTAWWLIPALYGESFTPAVPVLIVLGWGLIPALVTGLLILYLYAHGDEKFVNWLIAIGLVVQVAAALVLLRVYGAAGAAGASLISDGILWILLRQRISQLGRGAQTNWRALSRFLLPPVAVFGVALLVRLVPILRNSFDGLYGQDAYAYYDYARDLFTALTHLQPPPPFWWPLGYPVLLNVAFLVGGVNVVSAQAVTVLCGALVAPFAFALTYEAAPRPYKTFAAIVAGLICAVAGQLVQSSVVIMADAPALMFATLGAWLLLRYARTRHLITLCVAALAVGFAVWIRWQNLIFAAAWVAAFLLIELAPNPNAETKTPLKLEIFHVVLALALIGLVLSPQIFVRFASDAPLAGQSWLEGWGIRNAFARSFDNVDGHFDYALPVAVFTAQVFAHPAYLFALFLPFLLIGVALVKPSRSTRRPLSQETSKVLQLALITLLLGWTLAMFLFLAGIPYENFRFMLGLFTPLGVFSGLGAGWLWNRWRASRLRFALVGWIAVALLVMLLWEPRVLAPVLDIKAQELAQAQWLQQNIPNDGVLWTLGLDGPLQTYTFLHTAELWGKSADDLRATAPAYLFVDVSNLETQWRDKSPGLLFTQLHDSGHLYSIATYGTFTLFRIEP